MTYDEQRQADLQHLANEMAANGLNDGQAALRYAKTIADFPKAWGDAPVAVERAFRDGIAFAAMIETQKPSP